MVLFPGSHQRSVAGQDIEQHKNDKGDGQDGGNELKYAPDGICEHGFSFFAMERGNGCAFPISAKLFCKHSRVTFMLHWVVLKDERRTSMFIFFSKPSTARRRKNNLALMGRSPPVEK
jgi:hypothetical protein